MIDKIPYNPKELVTFLLGGTGVGKSTTMSFLNGEKIKFEHGQYISMDKKNKVISHS